MNKYLIVTCKNHTATISMGGEFFFHTDEKFSDEFHLTTNILDSTIIEAESKLEAIKKYNKPVSSVIIHIELLD